MSPGLQPPGSLVNEHQKGKTPNKQRNHVRWEVGFQLPEAHGMSGEAFEPQDRVCTGNG